MALHPQTLPLVPDATAATVEAAFPHGNFYVDLRAEFGTLYDDHLFADLYPSSGRPVEILPWRLALVLVMQYIEGLTDRQAADAVRRCIDWKYALSLELTDPGFDFTLLHDFRQRLQNHDAAHRLLDTFLTACKASGLIKPRGTQRTDSTHVLASIRTLHRLECVVEAMRFALNQLSARDPVWVQQSIPLDWFDRYGLRAERSRFPKEATKRDALAQQMAADGYALMITLFGLPTTHPLRTLPALEVLRQIWIQQFYHCTIPGAETVRWRSQADEPPSSLLIQSPYDLDARYGCKGEIQWIGYKVHLSETCDAGRPDLITQVTTTAASTADSGMGPSIQQALADRDLLPSTHLLDSGYLASQFLVTAQTAHQVDVVGPPLGSYSRQRRAGEGYDLHAFTIDWDREVATCPQGHPSVKWTRGHDGRGGPVMRIRFNQAICRRCPVRSACTWAKDAPRQLSVRPQAQYLALAAARQRQATTAFKALYALRAGIESTISQGTRRFALRRSRYIGLARTHVQHIVVAVAVNVVRVIAWLWNAPLDEQRRAAGHFALLAPRRLSRHALIC